MREVRVPRVAVAALALVGALALVIVPACYRPQLPDCQITCGDNGFCPGDLTCSAGNLCGRTACTATEIDAGTAGAWAALSVGSAHACAIDGGGGLWCWGNNDGRQLGRTTPTRSGSPVRVDEGGPADWASVSAGLRHTCAIRRDGTLWCWGTNDQRQCGVGAGSAVAPAAVAAPPAITGSRWTAVTTGAYVTCALRDDGSLWCFGTSESGELGQGTMQGVSAVPLRVGTFDDWRAIDAGLYHLCGVHGAASAPGRIACWGHDPGNGRIGDGNTVSRYQPTPVMDGGAIDWRALSVGDYNACALDAVGALHCWGDPHPLPGDQVSTVPTRYEALTGVTLVEVGGFGGCYVAAGQTRCWGDNDHGELARAPRAASPEPIAVDGLGASVDVGAGKTFGCALDPAGAIRCWGDNGDGQLGDGVITDPRQPVEVLGGHHPWSQVDIGADHTCAVTTSGDLYCWGLNDAGQLGAATPESVSATPVQVGAGSIWQQVGGGGRHSCALKATSALYCWGANDVRQRGVGDGTSDPMPVMVDAIPMSTISTGRQSSCGVRANGARRCWGDNDHTQLGNNSSDGEVATPTDIAIGPTEWSRMAMGVFFGCGIGAGTVTGVLYCWGENPVGQAARDPAVDNQVIIPVQVPDPTIAQKDDWIDVATDNEHACGVLSQNATSGSLYCWGSNASSQLGDANPGSHVLRRVGTASDWRAVGVGTDHTCGVHATGALDCFGGNGSGQLGDGTATRHTAADADVIGPADWVAVAAGANVSCGIRGGERLLFCWGENRFGQLGTGTSVRWVPAPVVRP